MRFLTNFKKNKKMRTLEINLYKFDELSDEAKEKAIKNYKNEYCEEIGTFWQEDNFNSIKAILNFFDVKIKNYEIDFSSAARSFINWEFTSEYNEEIKNLSGSRLYKYLQNNYVNRRTGSFNSVFDGKPDEGRCLFTGYCADHDIIYPVVEFLEKPTKYLNFKDLINNIIYAGLKYIENDFYYQNSDEAIIEEILNKDLYFNASGKIIWLSDIN